MAEVKMTNRDMFVAIAEICAEREDIVAFCEKEIGKLDRRAEYNRTHPRKSKTNEAVVEFRNLVHAWLGEQEVAVSNKDCAAALEVSSQKSANALNWLVKQGLASCEPAQGKTPKMYSAVQ